MMACLVKDWAAGPAGRRPISAVTGSSEAVPVQALGFRSLTTKSVNLNLVRYPFLFFPGTHSADL